MMVFQFFRVSVSYSFVADLWGWVGRPTTKHHSMMTVSTRADENCCCFVEEFGFSTWGKGSKCMSLHEYTVQKRKV